MSNVSIDSVRPLLNKIVSLKAADILLTLIEQNQVNPDDQIKFLENFFDDEGKELQPEIRIEQIGLWLAENGYATVQSDFQQQLQAYVDQEIQPLVDIEIDLSELLDSDKT